MKKISLLLVLFVVGSFTSTAQFSAGGGYSIYKSLNSTVTWQGIQGFVEFPRTESNTFFLRLTTMLPQQNTTDLSLYATAYELSTSPQQVPVSIEQISSTSFISIDGGNRTFFMNTYDAGVAPYFSSHARGIFGSAKTRSNVSYFDPEKYQSPYQENETKASSVFVGMGVNFGVKYQLPYRGAILFDLGVEYVLALYDAADFFYYGEITPISFFANVSYRFDWY